MKTREFNNTARPDAYTRWLRASLGLPETETDIENPEERPTARYLSPGTRVEVILPCTGMRVPAIVESSEGDCDYRVFRVRLARRGPRKIVEVSAHAVYVDGRCAVI